MSAKPYGEGARVYSADGELLGVVAEFSDNEFRIEGSLSGWLPRTSVAAIHRERITVALTRVQAALKSHD